MKKKPANFHGLLLIDKAGGMSSHDVVGKIRRAAGQRQVGHTGTLDPMATGLMGVLLGQATRLEPYLVKMDKVYWGQMRLGLTTDTDDICGATLEERGGPWPTEAEVRAALKQREGEGEQIPPIFSAIKIAGRRAYALARAGEKPEMTPRRVTARRLELLEYDPPFISFTAGVSSGYYIRSLARDLGRDLKLGGALSALRRLSVGPWRAEKAFSPETVAGWTSDDWAANLIAPAEALPHWPAAVLPEDFLAAFRQGRAVPFEGCPAVSGNPAETFNPPLDCGGQSPLRGPNGLYKVLDADRRLAGLAEFTQTSIGGLTPQGPFLRPLRVFNLGQTPNQPDGKE
ncbi:tRNA pseudouridine(55) synthase TruB [Deltaproteobacteria bacterium OttesenSCG-928-K17]|nr:tRNA pseudouridine(55) synthase TruB [Deltaproteobacteria bacterium OttesenSCG-928-K17]